MLKLLMLNDQHDCGVEIWKAGDVYEVEETVNDYYILKEVDGVPYAVNKLLIGIEFILAND